MTVMKLLICSGIVGMWCLLIADTTPASPEQGIALGVLSAKVSVNINADSIQDAVRQLVEQGGMTCEAVKRMSIKVDSHLKPVHVELKFSDTSLLRILSVISQHSAAVLEFDNTGNTLMIRSYKVVDYEIVRNYYLPMQALKLLGLPLESPEAAQKRLNELFISVKVFETDLKTGRLMLGGGGDLNLKTFEMLVNSISRTGLDISRLSSTGLQKNGGGTRNDNAKSPDNGEAPNQMNPHTNP